VLSLAKDSLGKPESTNDASGVKKEKLEKVKEGVERTQSEMD
jgi:hypothetical protein